MNAISLLCYIAIATLVACLGSWWHIIFVAVLLYIAEKANKEEGEKE